MSEAGEERQRILTGVRPTGALHLGHLRGRARELARLMGISAPERM